MGIIGRLIDDYICLRGALRALARTTPIAKNPSRVFPAVIAELAGSFPAFRCPPEPSAPTWLRLGACAVPTTTVSNSWI